MTYILIFISAVFVNNIVLAQFLGICPFLGVSKKIDTALGMSGAVAFVMTISTIFTYIIQKYVLEPFNIGFLQTITYILIIAALVQLVSHTNIPMTYFVGPAFFAQQIEHSTMRFFSSYAVYQALGVFLPLITTNCTILGVAIMVIQKDLNLLESVVFAISTAIGFGLALVLFAGIREQLSMAKLPKGMEGTPISLLTAGLLAMAFMGFAGIVR